LLWSMSVAEIGPSRSGTSAAFLAFPENQVRVVEFDVSSRSYQALSPRERQEQQRDWLLFAVLSASALPAGELEHALYDVPPVRNDVLAHLGQAETGEARSRMLGSQLPTVVALIPKADAATQSDLLADIADEQRKNSGEVPDRVHVFE